MRVDNIGHNQISAEAFVWYRQYLAALDAKDLDAFADFLAPEIEMRFNSEPAVHGHAAVKAALAGYWQSFQTLEHDLLNIYGTDHAFMLEALNIYTKKDGSPVTLRAVAMTDRDASGRVTSFRIYTDAQKLQ